MFGGLCGQGGSAVEAEEFTRCAAGLQDTVGDEGELSIRVDGMSGFGVRGVAHEGGQAWIRGHSARLA